MKVAILAGGFGTRISEESHLRPKPMIEIGGRPILWHIMKCYSYYGFNEFIILSGYKQEIIKNYFANYFTYNSDVTFKLADNIVEVHNVKSENWTVTVVDTGLSTMTGGRLKRIHKYVDNETFMLTYGDAVSDIDINELLYYHQKHNKIVTITTVNNIQGKGVLNIDSSGEVLSFREKSEKDSLLINGGFMVLEPSVFNYIDEGDQSVLEEQVMRKLVGAKQLAAYHHKGFWQCMDTLREKQILEELWKTGHAPWKIWEEQNDSSC